MDGREAWLLDPVESSPRAASRGLTVGETIVGIRYHAQIVWTLIDHNIFMILFVWTVKYPEWHLFLALVNSLYLAFFLVPTLYLAQLRFLVTPQDVSLWFSLVFIAYHVFRGFFPSCTVSPLVRECLLMGQGLVLICKILVQPKMRALVPIFHIALRKVLFHIGTIAGVCYLVSSANVHPEIRVAMFGACGLLAAVVFVSAVVEARAVQMPFLRFVDIMPDRFLLLDAYYAVKYTVLFYRIMGRRPIVLERALVSSGLAYHELVTEEFFVEWFGDIKGHQVHLLILQWGAEMLGRTELLGRDIHQPPHA